jgi:hypothetical protein
MSVGKNGRKANASQRQHIKYQGVTRGNQLVKEGPAASCGCPYAVACPQPTQGAPLKKKYPVGRFLPGFFLALFFFRGPLRCYVLCAMHFVQRLRAPCSVLLYAVCCLPRRNFYLGCLAGRELRCSCRQIQTHATCPLDYL